MDFGQKFGGFAWPGWGESKNGTPGLFQQKKTTRTFVPSFF
jgi:hypothetical protein